MAGIALVLAPYRALLLTVLSALARHFYLDRKQTQSGKNLEGILPLTFQFAQMVGGKTELEARQPGVFSALATTSYISA